MYMNIAALLLLLGITWVWLNRGFLNSLMHMACTIGAGAIAFAVWEPVATLLIDISPESGFASILSYVAWGGGLLLPFGVSLLLLRLVADHVVKMNVKPLTAVEYAGAGICGAISGAVTVGIVVISLGYLPLGTGFLGYRPINYSQTGSGSGSLNRADGLWIPVERWTAGFYGHLSKTSLRTGEPLALWYPELDLDGYAINTSVADGAARPAIKADHFRVLSTYMIGEEDGSGRMSDLLVESDAPDAMVQPYLDIKGETVSTGTIFGVVVEFKDGAKESNGQVVLGNGQAKLLMRDDSGQTLVAHPVALISQARSDDASLYGRWMFDGDNVFIASVGGSSTATMALEFVVPSGYTPEAVSIKNTRVLLDEDPGLTFSSAAARFGAIASGSLVGGASVSDVDTGDAVTVDSGTAGGSRNPAGNPIVDSNGIGFTFEVRQKGSIDLDDKNRIIRGSARFRPSDVNNRGADRNVLVDKISVSPDVVIVKVNVSTETPASLIGRASRSVDKTLPPQLIDTNGTAYPAVGFIYQDNEIIKLEYDPSLPIRGLAELSPKGVSLSSSRTDQTLTLLFRCSRGVELKYYAIGEKVVVELDPPLLLERSQG